MISRSRSGSNTSVASESEPSEARPQPSFRCTFLSSAGLLQRPQRTEARIEHEQQHQPAILVHEELAVAGLVALAADVVQPLEQRPELTKILEALDVFFTHRLYDSSLCMPLTCAMETLAQVKMGKRKPRAERVWLRPLFLASACSFGQSPGR